MTISYSDSFLGLLLRWKGSLYKAVLKDLLLFYLAYYVVMAVNVFLLSGKEKKEMTRLTKTFEKGTEYIPLSFLLGFFVAAILVRWWEQWNQISWPDRLMIIVGTWLPGEQYLLVRRAIARWSSLQAAMGWRIVSVRTKKRFPTEQHLVEAGLLTNVEAELFQKTPGPYGKWWLPSIWMLNLIRQCYADKRIDSIQMKHLLKSVISYKSGFDSLLSYDWVKIPMVYTQVAAFATYGYFILCIVARQPQLESEEFPIYFPLFTTLQFFFYMGWLKVGQFLMMPFGEDDDDFELNWILDRNTEIAFMLAENDVNMQCPFVETDILSRKRQLPHTKASMKIQDVVPPDHLAKVRISEEDMEMVSPEDQETIELGRRPVHRFRRMVQALRPKTSMSSLAEKHDEADNAATPVLPQVRVRSPYVVDTLPGEYDPVPLAVPETDRTVEPPEYNDINNDEHKRVNFR